MSFLYGIFLYFLPAVTIPFLISLIFNLNRKKWVFPSLEIIETLLSKELTQKKLSVRLKQILRALIVLLIVLSYAYPVPKKDKEILSADVVIDPTLSMSVYDLSDIVTRLQNHYSIGRLFFGDSQVNVNEIQESLSHADFHSDGSDWTAELNTLIGINHLSNLILITDAQKYQFADDFDIQQITGSFKILILTNGLRNIYVNQTEQFPAVSIDEVTSTFTIQLGGEIEASDRITVFLNDSEVYNGKADDEIEFNRYISEKGISFGSVVLEGDDFTNDNTFYFTVLSIGTPSVYNDLESVPVNRAVSAVFPDYYQTDYPENADLIITSKMDADITDSPVLLFCDPLSDLENTLRNQLGIFIQHRQSELTGPVDSDWDILDIIDNLKLETVFNVDFGKTIATVSDTPILAEVENYYIFNFSLEENESSLNRSVFLLLTLNEIIMNTYHSRFLVDRETVDDDMIFYNLNDVVYSFKEVKKYSGVFRLKDSQHYLVNNIDNESDFDFYRAEQFKDRLRVETELIPLSLLNDEKDSPEHVLYFILMIIALALFLVEAII